MDYGKMMTYCACVEGALIVNTGETLSRITNDTWPATRHYVLHARQQGTVRLGEFLK